MGALLEAETVIALLGARSIPLRRLQEPLTTATVMLDHTALAVGFAPEDVGKATAGAEHLHWLTVGIGFWLPHFRMMQVYMITGVINYQAILLAFVQAKTATHHLLVQADRLGWPKNGDQIHMGRIKASGEHRHVHQVLQLPLLEALDQKITIFQVGRPGQIGRAS